jgi:hypothetical protein
MDLTKIDKPFGELDLETKIALFAAWVDGAKIECNGTVGHPAWHLSRTYRVAPTKPSINWDHVAPQFKWMARDEDGETWLTKTEPKCGSVGWFNCVSILPADWFASFRPGSCDWKDSLVRRPE